MANDPKPTGETNGRAGRVGTTLFYALLLGAAGVWAASRPVSSGDLWVALGCGRTMLAHGIGRIDPFSFTSPPGLWINQNWLSHILFTGIERLAGLTGLGLWKVGVCVALSFLTAATARLLGASRSLAFFAGVGVAIVGRPFYDIRPNLHTVLLGAVLIHWLTRLERRPVRACWPLVPLMILWANLHGGFLFGVLGIAVATAAAGVRRWRSRGGGAVRLSILVVPAVALAATLVSPYGITNLTHPYEVSFGPGARHWRGVVEWLPPYAPGALREPGIRAYWALLVAGIGSVVLALTRRDKPTGFPSPVPVTAVAILALLLSLTSRRFIPLFAIASLPLLAAVLTASIPVRRPVACAEWATAALLVLTAVGIDVTHRLLLANPLWPRSVGWAERLVRADEQPADAVRFVVASGFAGRLLTDWTWGGYLLSQAPFDGDRPRYRIFIDGRAQAAYPVSVSEDWVALSAAAAAGDAGAVDAFLEYYRIDLCVLDRRGAGLALLIPRLPRWVAIYGDDRAVVAIRSVIASRLRSGVFPDEAIARVSAALRLATENDLDPGGIETALRSAIDSVRLRPTTTGVAEMTRLALAAPDRLGERLRREAREACDRILEGRTGLPGTPYEIATLRANTAQSRAVLAKHAADQETERRSRRVAREQAALADRYIRRILR